MMERRHTHSATVSRNYSAAEMVSDDPTAINVNLGGGRHARPFHVLTHVLPAV